MNPLLRTAAAHVVVESVDDPQIGTEDEHHLRRVLRIRDIDAITVTDGRGRWAPGRLTSTGVELTAAPSTEPQRATSSRTVVCAIPKGERTETIVQKLTELGLERIGLVTTARTVVRWDPARSARQLERLRRVAREAVMQSRRVWLPEVDLLTWREALALPAVALADPDGVAPDLAVRSIVVGPEGGFTPEELAECSEHVKLSDHVLRVDTAAISAGVLLMRSAVRADTT